MPRERDRHHHHHEPVVIEEGEALVTGEGEIILETPIRRSRAVLIHSEEAVTVYFSPDDDPCPPCAGADPDELEWEVIERRRELFLKIFWRVNCARTIIWKIYEVD